MPGLFWPIGPLPAYCWRLPARQASTELAPVIRTSVMKSERQASLTRRFQRECSPRSRPSGVRGAARHIRCQGHVPGPQASTCHPLAPLGGFSCAPGPQASKVARGTTPRQRVPTADWYSTYGKACTLRQVSPWYNGLWREEESCPA